MGLKPRDAANAGVLTGAEFIPIDTGADVAEMTTPANIATYMSNKIGGAGAVDADPTISAISGLDFTADACRVRLYDNATFSGLPTEYDIPAANFTATTNITNYLYVDYNAGTPIYKLTTNVALINESDTIPINTILASNSNLHLSGWDRLGDGLVNKLHRRFVKTQRYAIESGLAMSTPAEYIADGKFTIFSGVVWRGARAFELDDCYSDGTNSTVWFFYYQTAPNVWAHNALAPPFNTTQYSLNGVLTPLQGTTPANGYYNINWVFRGVEDHNHVYYQVSDKQYKDLATAQAESTVPPVAPDIAAHAILVGRIICQKSNVTPAVTDNPKYVEGAFTSDFRGTVINDHNSLSGLQGGAANDYVHLTTAEQAALTNFVTIEQVQDNIGGTTGGDGFLQTGDDHLVISYDDAGNALTFTVVPKITFPPSSIEFGGATQNYDCITGGTDTSTATYVAAVAGGALGGIPNIASAGNTPADAILALAFARDGKYVYQQELTGAASATNPLTTHFIFTGITRFDTLETRSRYVGSIAHNMSIGIYNWSTAVFDEYVNFSGESAFASRAIQIFNPLLYIGTGGNAGKVIVQFIHLTSGINTHEIRYDYIALADGGGGGGSLPVASAVGYTAVAPETKTNVQTALENRPNYNVLGALATGVVKVTTSTGALTSTGLGTTLQVLRTNAAATDVEWSSVDIDYANPLSITTTANLTIGKHHVMTGTTADYTVTLPAVSGNEGKLISIEMSGALTKLITVEGNASETIDGALNRIMWARETAILLCNGTTWTKVCGKSIPMWGAFYPTTALSPAHTVLTRVPLEANVTEVGRLRDTVNTRVLIPRSGTWNFVGIAYYQAGTQNSVYVNVLMRIDGSTQVGMAAYGTAFLAAEYSMFFTANTPIALNAGQYVDLMTSQQSATTAARPLYVNNVIFTRLQVQESITW